MARGKFEVTVLDGQSGERGCRHHLKKASMYRKCAACGDMLCKDCRRPALLPGKFVCKNGCPEWAVEQTQKSFHSRYTMAVAKAQKGGKA